MKYFFVIALLIARIGCNAQTTDSTEIKLSHAKDLFIKNLITAQEYEAVKAQILGIKSPAPQPIIVQNKALPKMDSIQIEKLNTTGAANQGIGSFMIIGSAALSVGAVAVAVKQRGKSGINPLEIALPILSVVLFIPGVCLVVEGSRQRHRYRRYKDEVAINISGDSIGLAYNF